MTNEKLAELRKIPSMGGHCIGEFLYELGLGHQGRGEVVEVGSWLGSSCAHLALGLSESRAQAWIHCYDRFQSNESECDKARAQGVPLSPGQDTIQVFLDNVLPIYPRIRAHKTDLLETRWDGTPIEIYVDDAAKRQRHFVHVMKTFGPSFIPGLTTVVLMDLNMYRHEKYTDDQREEFQVQRRIMDQMKDHFRETFADWPRSSMVSFKYDKRFDFASFDDVARRA